MLLFSWVFTLAVLGLAGAALWYRARDQRARATRLGAATAGLVALGLVAFARDLGMQKLLGVLVMPLGLIWLGQGALTIHLAGRRLRRAGLASGALFAALTACGNPWLCGALLRALESQVPDYSLASDETFEAVLVLGGGVNPARDGHVELSEHGDRAMLAARMYLRKKTPLLVTSGSTIPELTVEQSLAAATAEIWRDLGIPESAIIQVPEPKNTSMEIAAYKALVTARGLHHVGLLSSAWHLPRALRLCRKVGLEVRPLPADHRGEEMLVYHPGLMIPQASALARTKNAIWELVGMLAGR